MDDDEYIELTTMEQECILYRLADFPWIIENLMDKFYPPAICHHAMTLCDMVESGIIPKTLCELSKAIMTLCVEKSDWLEAPEQFPDCPGHPITAMKKTLRSVARRLEEIGVEINHLPA